MVQKMTKKAVMWRVQLKKQRKIGWVLVPHNTKIRISQKWLKKKRMQPFVLQSHIGEQSSSIVGPLRDKGGSLHKAV